MTIEVIERGRSNNTGTTIDVYIKLYVTGLDDKYTPAQLRNARDRLIAAGLDVDVEKTYDDVTNGRTGTFVTISGTVNYVGNIKDWSTAHQTWESNVKAIALANY